MLSADLFRDRRSQLAKVILMLCGCYFALAFAGQAWKAKGFADTLALERARLEQQQLTNTALRDRLTRLQGPAYDAYVERTAREQLQLAKPGDVALFVVPDPSAPSREPSAPLRGEAPSAAALPHANWRQWVSVFFP